MLMVIYVIKYGDKHIFYSAACPQYLTVLIFFFWLNSEFATLIEIILKKP